jgi:arylsulfatase A-like enzyme
MKKNSKIFLAAAMLLPVLPALAAAPHKPNIIIIYGDDIGFGDLQCYGGSHVRTPNANRLAEEGLRFVNGYATSATCTPSRFSILTGEYAFRKKGSGVLPGDAALLIRPGSMTLPAILQHAGYATAAIGKWHLGLGAQRGAQDWNGVLKPGPLEVGFDYCFIIPATPDRVPCVFVQNHRVFNLDPSDPIRVSYSHPFPGEVTGKNIGANLLKMDGGPGSHRDAVINDIGRIGYMTGGKSALWKDEEIEEVLAKQAVDFIEKEKGHPFFLYYASHDIHVPRVPNKRCVGKTGMGPRGDELAEFDWAVGQILQTLDRFKLTDNTLVMLSSDNGPVLRDYYEDQANQLLGDHKPAGPLRAGKYSIFDGGTRVPFIVCWPGKVKPGVSQALVSQVDLLASLAALTGQTPDPNDAPDSQDVLPALLGQSPQGRTSLIEYRIGKECALRDGEWKFIPPGRTMDHLGPFTWVRIPKPGFLFNLTDDAGETNNLAAEQPDRVSAMASQLAQFIAKTTVGTNETSSSANLK